MQDQHAYQGMQVIPDERQGLSTTARHDHSILQGLKDGVVDGSPHKDERQRCSVTKQFSSLGPLLTNTLAEYEYES
jgi:hypothetical protein